MTTTTAPPGADRTAGARGASRARRALRGPAGQPAWARPALLVLLAATAVLYVADLSASGYANSFYAAAVQAGSQSWSAWFFGSLDPAGFITVDKPPASLWVMGLAARAFGFSSWSLLVPQAVEGVLAVWLLVATVRRWHGWGPGLVAGAALAATPAAALMFRFDNPDALLVLLMVAAAAATVRATERASWRWLALAGVALGFAFLTKMLQGFLVLPALALLHLWAAPTGLGRRALHLLGAGVALVVSAGWWVLAVTLWPGAKPYVGGSTDGTVMDLVLGYNGLGRLLGGDGGPAAGGGTSGGVAGSSFGGAATWRRLFSSEMGDEISWLLPAALLALVLGLIVTRRAPRADRTRGSLVLWGTWLVVSGGVFSYMEGTVHPYYTVALAPAVAALVAVGGHALWVRRASLAARAGLALVLVAAVGWSSFLLHRDDLWPVLARAVLAVGVLAAGALVVTPVRLRRLVVVLVLTGTVAGLAAPASFAVATAATPHTGSIPSAGPSSAAGAGFPGGGARPAGAGPTGGAPQTPAGATASGQAPATGAAGTGGGPGGDPDGASGATDAALVTLLQGAGTTWAAATSGSQSAAELELASGEAVMAMGGWSGDPTPTLAQFQAYVAAGQVHYLVGGEGAGGRGGSSTTSEVLAWVQTTFTSTTVGGQTVYDLTQPLAG